MLTEIYIEALLVDGILADQPNIGCSALWLVTPSSPKGQMWLVAAMSEARHQECAVLNPKYIRYIGQILWIYENI